ncbi:MAG: ABC-F family ATP-binding cassette domain-containing protein [Clostridiales bacterium]|nr:ABC-F family ATP-binding cassette domain-containing protein [Clostridiales bacterium]
MIDIAGNELHKYYGSNHVIRGITFDVYSGERVGLLGKNGSGKTTLFRMITGEEFYESGSIFRASGRNIGMLSQIPVFGENDTAEDVLRSSFGNTAKLHREMSKIAGNADPKALARYGRLMEEYERLGGYETEVRLDKICSGMRIDSAMRKSRFNRLSGGEQTRVNLGRILLKDCDILLLDEPTNHLDLASIEWLEGFLRRFIGTVLVISHDRAFLDAVISRVIELEDGKANFYQGNYSQYIAEKEQRIQTQTAAFETQQKKIKQLDTAAKRLHDWARRADNEALHKKAFAIEKRIERMDKVEKPASASVLTAGFGSVGYAAKVIASFSAVSKRYGEKVILNDSHISVCRHDRIALVGANGCGKTTLLKMLTGEEAADSGTVKVSPNAKPAYMPQTITFPNPDASALETLCLATGETQPKARAILAKFHFRADDVFKKAGALSGGEKSRLKLCLMMQNDTNFLLLDEPTNHLDIATREWIETTLADFDGAMLFVSHDRYLLKKFAEKIWHIGGGVIMEYNCGYDEYTMKVRAGLPNNESGK